MKISREVMIGEAPKVCLLIVALALGSASPETACELRRTRWDRERGTCVPCTRCEPNFVVKLPCELHRDTVCQALNEAHVWPFDTPNPSDSELYNEYDNYADDGEVSDEGAMRWDLQATTLTLAASGCVVFFVVSICLLLHHTKQWRVLKRALRSDMQDLSAKLKLMEAGETPAEPVVPAENHIYSNIQVAKDSFLGPASVKKGLGNVYTQEKHPS